MFRPEQMVRSRDIPRISGAVRVEMVYEVTHLTRVKHGHAIMILFPDSQKNQSKKSITLLY